MASQKCRCGSCLTSTSISVSGIRLQCKKCATCGQVVITGKEAFKFLSYKI